MSVPLPLSLSIIIPVKRDDPFIERCIDAVLLSASSGSDIIIVLDGWDTDRLERFVADGKVRIFSHLSAGPAACRHFGACQAVHDWLCLVDSDVIVRKDTFEKAMLSLHHSGDDGLIGSYDDQPEAPTTVSRFRNLLHHYHHQRNHGASGVFWGAFGILRRAAYLKVGGFDPAFRNASVEDIELGYRLALHGFVVRIRSDIQVCHLKRWTLRNMIQTDVWLRAKPWTILMRRYRRWGERPLNTSVREQFSALLACLFPLALSVSCLSKWMLPVSAGLLICFLLTQADFYRFALRRFNLIQIPQVLCLHHIYFCSAAFGWLLATVTPLTDPNKLEHG